MSSIEMTQVVLRLTKDTDVLMALRKNKRLVKTPGKDGEPVDTYVGMFDARAIEFKAGQPVALSKTVADAMRRDNWVIVGPHIDGEVRSVFDVVKTFELGSQVEDKPQFMCPVCKKDMQNLYNLTKHLNSDSHKKEKEVIDFETPLTEQIVETSLPGDEEDEG